MIALVTASTLPEPDPDAQLLVDALRACGEDARIVAWDDETVAWGAFHLAVIRSTWNYHHRRDAFVAWAERVSTVTRLFNDAHVVAWNSDKRYLTRFARAGLPVVPTLEIDRGSRDDLATLAAQRSWREVVVKPRVSAGSFETHRFRIDDLRGGELAACARDRDVLVQPYVRSVDDHGERSLVWIDGSVTHAIRKSPRFASDEERVMRVPVADDELACAGAFLRQIAEPILYARIDLARDERGAPMLMELELVEPSLFLGHAPGTADVFARAIAARLA